MERGEELAQGDGQHHAGAEESGSRWVPSKKPVPGGRPEHKQPGLSQVRVKVLADLTAMIDRLERAVRRSPSTEPRRKPVLRPEPDMRTALREFSQRQDTALDRLDEVAERLAMAVERLEGRLAEWSRRPPETAPMPPSAEEAQPPPGPEAISIILAPVADFQSLMEMHRALSGLPVAEGASVITYRNGEASFELRLHGGVDADRIVQELQQSTGHPLFIEESKPDAHRLRLRLRN